MKFANKNFKNPVSGNLRPGSRGFSVFIYLFLAVLISLGTAGCSRKIPCPKIPKQKRDTAFKPSAVSDEDDGTNNPNDNAATMTLGGGGFKRDKNGLVKKRKYKNLLSKQARERKKYTRINEPSGGGSAYPKKYTKIQESGWSGSNAYTKQYSKKPKEPGGKKNKKRKYRKNVEQPGSSTPGFND